MLTDRRCALRVPVRGFAVLHAENGPGPLHGSLENLSQSGALVNVASKPPDANLDLELRLSEGDGWVTARTVRIDSGAIRDAGSSPLGCPSGRLRTGN